MNKNLLFAAAVMATAVGFLAAACGGGEEATPTRAAATTTRPAATPTPAPQATATPRPTAPPAATATRAPIATQPSAATQPPATGAAQIEISSVGDELKFDKTRISAKTGAQVQLIFKNVSSALQHNWTLVKQGTKDQVAADGVAAGAGNDWVKPNDDRVIAYTKQVDPKQTATITFIAPAAGTYQYLCTFPGHNVTMWGTFEVTQ